MKSKLNTREKGRHSEKEAEKYLTHKSYVTIERNYTSPHGEIDLIMYDGKQLVFIEVKSGYADTFEKWRDCLNDKKYQHLHDTAQHWLQQYNMLEASCRFDVVFVCWDNDKVKSQVHHIKNAFLDENGKINID